MITSAIVSALHVLALPVGLPAVLMRGRALKRLPAADAFVSLFAADAAWGAAALLWLGTGLLRAFGGLDKGGPYYLHNGLFHAKLTCFILIWALEGWPMVTFIRWRLQRKKGQTPDVQYKRIFFILNHVELALAVTMVFLAAFMARGFGAF
jgi:putative membrane protein